MKRLVNDDTRFEELMISIRNNNFAPTLNQKQLAGVHYAEKLTQDIKGINKADVEVLKATGLDDGEILEINQVVSYFNYVNRTVLGLGVHTEGDIIGLSPRDSDDPDNWNHD